jgi:hypothetical protein
MLSKNPWGHTSGACLLSLCVHHFGELLKYGSSSHKAVLFFVLQQQKNTLINTVENCWNNVCEWARWYVASFNCLVHFLPFFEWTSLDLPCHPIVILGYEFTGLCKI